MSAAVCQKWKGFSLLELTIALAILLIAAGFAVPSLKSALADWHGEAAYTGVYDQVKLAGQLAANHRQEYKVVFTPGDPYATPPQNGSVEIDSLTALASPINPSSPFEVSLYTLPPNVAFTVPTAASGITAPDAFGSATTAIDFSYPATVDPRTIYFTADGRVLNAPSGAPVNGVVYLYESGNSNWGRAITVWGYTAKVKGWELIEKGAAFQWAAH
jgi:prepilin-type N-terminal cleavage/methylation domain-containing protein